MFEDMVARVEPVSLKESPVRLNVATLCSGTDAPIFALSLIQEALVTHGFGAGFEFQHLFSCEIEPFKQGFIRRNLPPGTLIFRDVVELASTALTGKATTASGSKAEIPASKVDILFAGCSCVDYSNMNQNKPSGRVPALDRHLKQQQPKEGKRRATKKQGSGKRTTSDAPEGGEVDGCGDGDGGEGNQSPILLDQTFVDDLDEALRELALLSSGGESARTFFAAIKLITVIRPKLVILENVYNAPWDMYTEQIFPKICYVADFVRLDSKDFYLPQTRQRGYLVAVDAAGIGARNAGEIVRGWKRRIPSCQRPASAPVSVFLRPADDPATIQARADMKNRSSPNAEWALCSLRHADVRQRHGIRRDDNPFSLKAMRNSRHIFAAYPSHSWMQFWDGQVARVADFMDIAFAALRNESVDLGYKTCMIDVSQNVDRNDLVNGGRARVRSHLGVVGCITPSGMPIVTDLMRPITGFETLALQGLPVDDLVVSTESQAQLRDLAGNAMTVTVVGAVTLAALLAVLETNAATGLLDQVPSARPKPGLYLEFPEPGESLERGRNRSIVFDAQMLLGIAKRMMRLCSCPAPIAEVLACADCGTTACSACRGNPVHRFVARVVTGSRYSAEQGKVRLADVLPNALMLPVPEAVVHTALGSVKGDLYRSVVRDILNKKDAVFFLDEIKVTEAVTVCYKKADSIARLVFSADSACCWYIYVAPWHHRRVELSECFDLDQPIARGQVLSGDISAPHWSLWVPTRIDLELGFAEAQDGQLRFDRLSFAGGHDLGPDPSLQHWKRLVEARVCGTYTHHPGCGTAGSRLHVKQPAVTADGRVFLMWESARLRDPDDDHFIWTETMRRMEPHEYRPVLLHARPARSWKLDHQTQERPMSVFWPGYWSWPPEPTCSDSGTAEPYNPVRVHWGPAEAIQQAPCHADGQAPVAQMAVLAAVSATFRGFPLSASRCGTPRSDTSFYVVPPTGLDTFLRMVSFASSEVRWSRRPESLALAPHLDGSWVPVARCRVCSVTPPKIAVYARKDPKRAGVKTSEVSREKKARGGSKGNAPSERPSRKKLPATGDDSSRTTKVVIEDPDEAATFERHYQDLPRAVAVAAHIRPDSNGFLTLDMRLLLQPKTLASRALAHLLQAHHTAARGRTAVDSGAVTSFTVTLDYTPGSTADFGPFIDSVRPCSAANTTGIDLARDFELPDADPPRFRRTMTKARKMGPGQYRLRPSQREAVNWMLQRERVPLDFVKREVEEEVVAPLNLRVLGKAEWTNRFPYCSRGGVVAHEVGYGKTVVTLAVCDHMREFDTTESVAERADKVDAVWSEELSSLFGQLQDNLPSPEQKVKSFFCHLSATLVVVPKHITAQWESEAAKFLGLTRPKVLVIKTVAAFYGDCLMQQLQEAEFIIVSSAVFGKAFLERLETVSGPDDSFPAGLSGRTLEAWYREALRAYRVLTAYYLSGRDANIPYDQLMETIEEKLVPGLRRRRKAEIDALVMKQVPEIDRQYYKKKARDTVDAAGLDTTVGGPGNDLGAVGFKEGLGDITLCTEQRDAGSGKKRSSSDPVEAAASEAAKVKRNSKARGPWAISCLHNCSFARVVWDECSYDDDDNIRLFVAHAVANTKWLLSGTPKLFALEQVCRISAAFGVHVARPEPRITPGLPAVTKGPELAPMSKSEQFHKFCSPVKSVTLARERHAHAETFVAAYFRANALDAEVDIESEEHVVPVDMTEPDSVRYHLLTQEVLDADFDYTALPEHARREVALKGADLLGKDGSAAAKMLLGLLACGLGKHVSSVNDLTQALEERSARLGCQMKFLWDKMMWLRRWILRVFGSRAGSEEGLALQPGTSIKDSLARVEALCSNMNDALLGDGSLEPFGGIDVFLREASIVAHQQIPPQGAPPHSASDIMQSLRPHFCSDWKEGYNIDKALYTWLDFFAVTESTLDRLTEDQLRLLAEDLCWLKYKIDPRTAPFSVSFPVLALTGAHLAPEARRSIPPDIRELFEVDKRVIDSLTGDEIRHLVRSCARVEKLNTTRLDASETDHVDEDCASGASRSSLVEILTEVNVKFAPNAATEDLKEKLRRHRAGLATCENYRDGRAPPDRHRDFEAATMCTVEDVSKQAEAVNEELKRTMVHLAKTVEDLRATMLETKFIPRYSQAANALDKDGVIQTHACCGCQNLLPSATASFLVVACGHLLCCECRSTAGFYCPVRGCPAFIRKRPVIRCSHIPTPSQAGPRDKADHVVELVRQFPADEYIVVFAQYRRLISSLAAAFNRADLRVLDLSAAKDDDIARKLEAFKIGKAGRILLLDMDSETSAGSNLTIATRVIFASPYVHQDEEHQVRTVRQAKGRCIRTGQTKKVHVYHFMVPGTIEEETLRTLGRHSPPVQEFFDNFERKPWWLDL
ncbi:hypothetical protein MYCTH_2307313 [Thermothelomyces thermophilus ATCC 42464]|uniref:Helicase ATP-binding domain-containing protein n=1 Tax=Thermothelomyces thermophilus (strain ATCC 42464 / BCRC 31852 / DSM 1799) TaxID=573729 RepID=G2QFI9_THET4|nr:uncharacterized protein MYCTH_2307313 [Thermothelomyces thermophilus ATCC 42464]AEO59218.1 hypothetical protein MYCTH_2307313 [Thermothelomyces thermophilus ATCC 42464]